MAVLKHLASVARDPRWWLFYLQRGVLSPGRRIAVASWIARLRPRAVIRDKSAAVRGAAELNDSGIHSLGELLTAAQCKELVAYFEAKNVHDPYNAANGEFLPLSDEKPSGAHIAHHFAADIIDAPYLLDLANDPRILDIAGSFLGCKPTIGYMAAWWSYPTSRGPQQAENFHRDADDWRFVKLFVYLTPVDSNSGPHKYVQYSSRTNRLNKIRRYEDHEVEAAFGADNVRVMMARAGEGFLEDTYGIHKGQPVKSGHRLLFQVVYTLFPLPYAPATPVKSASGMDHDGWMNRVYLRRAEK